MIVVSILALLLPFLHVVKSFHKINRVPPDEGEATISFLLLLYKLDIKAARELAHYVRLT